MTDTVNSPAAHASIKQAGSVETGISIRGVNFTYRPNSPQSLVDFSLDVAPGELVLVTGASGSGKTTVARLVNGLAPHFTRTPYFRGTSVLGHMFPPKSNSTT